LRCRKKAKESLKKDKSGMEKLAGKPKMPKSQVFVILRQDSKLAFFNAAKLEEG